jgi:HK97 family phage prohead protease
MRIEIRGDKVIIDGYVNAVERQSRPVLTPYGKAIEVIQERAFDGALQRAENVDILLNHNSDRKLGSTKDGNLELWEDAIGLRAVAEITDAEVIEKARNNELRGWSFGFTNAVDQVEQRTDELPLRKISDLDLKEVSIIDSTMTPCYRATSIEMRADEVMTEHRSNEVRAVVENMVETPKKPDYKEYHNRINRLKVAK